MLYSQHYHVFHPHHHLFRLSPDVVLFRHLLIAIVTEVRENTLLGSSSGPLLTKGFSSFKLNMEGRLKLYKTWIYTPWRHVARRRAAE